MEAMTIGWWWMGIMMNGMLCFIGSFLKELMGLWKMKGVKIPKVDKITLKNNAWLRGQKLKEEFISAIT